MIGAVIYYGKNTLVAELPMGTLDLQMKLSSIGVGEPADRIPLKDDEERQLQVKLYASSPEEAHLLSLLPPERSLADANTCADLLWQAEQRALPRLKCGLLSDSYSTLDDFINAAKDLFARERVSQAAQPETPPQPKPGKDPVLEEYEHNPNIRLVVRCTHQGKTEMIPLPLNDPQFSAVYARLDSYGENSYSLGIEANRYRGSWPGCFAKVLQDEGLFALNLFAASFPIMEEVNKFEAVVEYVEASEGMNVDDSKTLIALADAEANVDGHWYNLCPFFKNRDGVYKTGCLFWAQSAFREIHNELQSHSIGHGIPEDISEGLREVFPQKLDEVVEGGWSKKTWGEYYKQSLYQVNFAQAIAPKVNKTKPFKYEGYVLKKELAAFEVYEIDEFSEWLTEEEYQALSEKERCQYIFHRWNDPYGDYGIYVEIYRKVRVLCSLFQDVMEEDLGGSLWDGITDSQVRLYVYFG